MSAAWRRLRMLTPPVRDRIAVAVLLLAAAVEALTVERDVPLIGLLVAAAGFTLPLAWRREHPVLTAGAVVAVVVAESALLADATDYFVPFVCAMTVAYGTGAYVDGRAALAGLAIVLSGIATVSALAPGVVAGDVIFPTAFGGVVWLAGRAVRTRTRLTEELHEAAVREQDAQAREALRAAGEERRRIAREMHDVVAHSVSVMVVQAGGARRILERDPARAVAAAEQIERTGREALAEMRRLLGVLHHDEDDSSARAPQPGMAAVGALVERAREAGLPVGYREEGARRPLPAGLDLAAYRVIQEALTNALRYSGQAATEVRVRWGEGELVLEIADRGPGPVRDRIDGEHGHGLAGMRERVRLYGGELEAGRRPGGGFRIAATLPLAGADSPVEAAV